MVISDKIEKALAVLPHKPGVYLMHDSTGRVIYVGKAKNLNNRVHSYFRASGRHSVKVEALVSHVEDLETIMTDSEIEALILECNLIKKYRPRYNIMLRDDKTYPYLKITLQEEGKRRREILRSLSGCRGIALHHETAAFPVSRTELPQHESGTALSAVSYQTLSGSLRGKDKPGCIR